jgi:minichromosome maintenance protein 10
MQGRYFLSPSMLYSVVRLQPNKQAYDVPVEGDYVIIGVVAERLPVRMSKAPVGITREAEDDGGSDDEFTSASAAGSRTKKGKGKGKGPPPRSGRKYVTLKLIDFGARSASSATGGKAALRGDAFLNLLLFESEDVKDVVDPETGKKERVYRGGSRGAFEQMAALREGSVVALLNPRVLRPFQVTSRLTCLSWNSSDHHAQKSNDTPHPVTNVLGITPESAESAMVLGYAKDLGICAVVRKDGKPCGSWTDKRTSEVCDYHVQNAVQQRRAGRAEFSTGYVPTSRNRVQAFIILDRMQNDWIGLRLGYASQEGSV